MLSPRERDIVFWGVFVMCLFIGCTVGSVISSITTEKVIDHFYPGQRTLRCLPMPAANDPAPTPAQRQEVAHA